MEAEAGPTASGGSVAIDDGRGSVAVERSDTRRRLIAAAADVFATRGLSAPMEEVAARAGVTRMTLYRHLGSRQELLVALLQYKAEEAAGEVTAILFNVERAFPDRVIDFILYVVASVRHDPFLSFMAADVTPAQVNRVDPQRQFVESIWTVLLPIFELPEHRAQLGHEPARCLDWTLRQVLLQLMVEARLYESDDDRRAELEDFLLPALRA
ncbi:MAG: TetR/AcrR family transcriptional regulator [Acidimicrobiales bacterium]